jgi:hypothetical protein
MAYGIYLPQRWRRQPPYPVGLDVANHLGQGLLKAHWVNAGPEWTAFNGPTQVVNGPYSTFNYAAASSQYFTTSIVPTTNAVTFLALVRLADLAAANRSFISAGAGTNDRFLLYSAPDVGVASFRFFVGSGGTTVQIPGTGVGAANTEWNLLIGRQNSASSRDIWRNGIVLATNTTTVNVAAVNTVAVGGYWTSGAIQANFYMNGQIALAAMWGRALSDDEIREVSINPWQLFRPATTPVIYSLPSAGAFTLALDAGSYNLTGQNLGLTSARSMALDTGAYNLSGQDVTLTLSGTAPVLSAATVFNITTNSVNPRVTITF